MRHARQAKLAEIGEAVQTRLAGASASVPGSDLAAEIAARYLAGAGVGHLRVSRASLRAAARAVDPTVDVNVDPSLDDSEPTCPFAWRDPAAADLARGAYLALHMLRVIIEDNR